MGRDFKGKNFGTHFDIEALRAELGVREPNSLQGGVPLVSPEPVEPDHDNPGNILVGRLAQSTRLLHELQDFYERNPKISFVARLPVLVYASTTLLRRMHGEAYKHITERRLKVAQQEQTMGLQQSCTAGLDSIVVRSRQQGGFAVSGILSSGQNHRYLRQEQLYVLQALGTEPLAHTPKPLMVTLGILAMNRSVKRHIDRQTLVPDVVLPRPITFDAVQTIQMQ